MSKSDEQPPPSPGQGRRHRRGAARNADVTSKRLRTVREFSAGGLLVDGIGTDRQFGVIIGRADRRGRTLWLLPKGHIEIGECPDETAVREIAEETGIRGDVMAPLGSVDYWFRAEAATVHKTVRHYLLRFREGEAAIGDDHEVTDVAWVSLEELPSRLTHADEGQLATAAIQLIQTLRDHGLGALPPIPRIAPRRRPQRHSISMHRGQSAWIWPT